MAIYADSKISVTDLDVFTPLAKTEVINVPAEERRTDSNLSEQAADIKNSPCTIEMKEDKDLNLTITVTGRPTDVIEAKRIINCRMRRFTGKLIFPKEEYARIFGKFGARLRGIELLTDVDITIKHDDENDEDDENISLCMIGTKEELAKAQHQIQVAFLKPAKTNMCAVVTEVLSPPTWLFRYIVGHQRKNAKKITEDLPKVQIIFSRADDKIFIEGPPDQVQVAKERAEAFIEVLNSALVCSRVHVKKEWHRFIVGKRGEKINRIKDETCTDIFFPRRAPDPIRIMGLPEGVQAAEKMIAEVVAELEDRVSKRIFIDHKWHSRMIGKNGVNIKDVIARFKNVIVVFPPPDAKLSEATIHGPSDEVEECAKYLQNMASDFSAGKCTEKVRIPKELHCHIVGRGGATLLYICEQTNTRVNVPRLATESEMIEIIGDRKDVQDAREIIRGILTGQEPIV